MAINNILRHRVHGEFCFVMVFYQYQHANDNFVHARLHGQLDSASRKLDFFLSSSYCLLSCSSIFHLLVFAQTDFLIGAQQLSALNY